MVSNHRRISLPAFIVLALSVTGCVATTVSKAVNGKAYVVKGGERPQ